MPGAHGRLDDAVDEFPVGRTDLIEAVQILAVEQRHPTGAALRGQRKQRERDDGTDVSCYLRLLAFFFRLA
jgi:hypothetical protein